MLVFLGFEPHWCRFFLLQGRSPQGSCVNGRCQCREGFGGESCETPMAQAAPQTAWFNHEKLGLN
jgi:hypothetical protein